ncbi:MAG: hypothetical protein H6813_05905 [Phycisphaeraceae bacterium]|nr:hypothetical protein [Phycisphaeraceae bacterium]MCB9848003.1 hypothetical protein [Phycisphaeraceae bacterium]
MASPRRHSTLIELIRDRPNSYNAPAPIRADRVKPEPVSRSRRSDAGAGGRGGFDIASLGRWFAAGRRLNLPMGYVFIAVALVLISWIGAYMIGYSRAENLQETERIARLTSTADPLLSQGDAATPGSARPAQRSASNPQPMRTPAQRQVPQVSSNGPTGAALPKQTSAASRNPAPATRAGAALPAATFEPGLNYLVIANYHREEAEQAAAFLIDNDIRATVMPVNNGATWRVVGLRGFTSEQMKAGDHRQYRDQIEALGRLWERDHNGSDNFSGMFFRKEKG